MRSAILRHMLQQVWRSRFAAIAAVLLILSGGGYARYQWPVYGFMAHRGDAPIGPLGWMELPGAPAPRNHDVLDPEFTQEAARALQHLEDWRSRIEAPAMSAAVAIHGELVWRGAVGWADLASQQPATPETEFRIGSTSKALTATALARLVERGEVRLDTPLSEYFSDLPNEAWANITARQLASHSSGLPHYRRNSDRAGRRQTMTLGRHFPTVQSALEVFDGSELLSEPGTDFHYSSFGAVLLGALLSEATGRTYTDVVETEVLAPVGMVATRVAPRGSPGAMASFYLERNGRYRRWRRVDLSHRLPGGGWASTPSDLARMGAAWLDDDFLSEETRTLFWEPQRLANGEVNEQDYAIGWRWREFDVESVGIARNANHGGVSRGSQSWLLVFPEFGMTIAVTVNMNTDEFRDFGLVFEGLLRAFRPASQLTRLDAGNRPDQE